MKILIACVESVKNKRYTSNDSLIQAFRELGHEVITAGPVFENFDGELTGTIRDIRVHDKREHPETWTYKEILDKCDKKPDLILQIDPHFYFVGEKPKDITTAYYIVDVHRGASVFRKMALAGNFDYVFIAHKYFEPLFEHVGIKTFWLPRGYDDLCIKDYGLQPECDLAFIGENGLNEKINTFNKWDAEVQTSYHEGPYPPVAPQDRYRSWENHTMEYAERAEILYRLSQDFNLRVYQDHPPSHIMDAGSRGPNYAKMLSRGKIVVNHSLHMDSALRNFEVLACNRFLISDMLPYQDELLTDGVHYKSYNHYFLPFLENFRLEYEIIKRMVEYYLKNENERKEIINKGNELVKKHHTFKERARTIIDTVKGKKNGYTKPY